MANVSGRLASLMTVVALASSIFCTTAQRTSSMPQSDASATEQIAVEIAYKAYLRAWKDKDYAALDRLLNDDYRAVNFRGIVSTKANEIATAREDSDYADMKGNVMSVTVFGDSAVASGLIEASRKDDQRKMERITVRFLAMFHKQKGEWKLVPTQSANFSGSGMTRGDR